MNEQEYCEMLAAKLTKSFAESRARVNRLVTRVKGPVRFCSACGEKMIIRSSRTINENHKEFFYVCEACHFKDTHLVRLFDIHNMFTENTPISDMEKFISAKDIQDNWNEVVRMIEATANQIRQEEASIKWYIKNSKKEIKKKYELLDQKIDWIMNKVEK